MQMQATKNPIANANAKNKVVQIIIKYKQMQVTFYCQVFVLDQIDKKQFTGYRVAYFNVV